MSDMPEIMQSSNTITLRLPKFNWQIGALILVAVIAAFQTYQLSRLKGLITLHSASAAASASGSASPAPAASGSTGLQSMVGGC